ncbi:MAG TPA: hypothetical protein VNP04_21510 [Alphaproteobacteria bacterium]|nr:hypothetical protein [Alphaproteobacteria bacterium]
MRHHLQHESAAALDVRFASGTMPVLDDLQGHCRGCFLAWNDELSWPVWLMLRVLRAMLFDWRGWWGKDFVTPLAYTEPGRGWNLFPARGANDDWRYPFATYLATAFCDGRAALRLNYGAYRSLMSWVRDDLRQIDERLWLGKMWVVWRQWRLFVGFFALWKETPYG